MKGFAYQLLRPVTYLFIEDEQKWKVDWLIPGIFAALGFGATLWFRPAVSIFGEKGVLHLLLGFVQTMPGFYMAALAAIAVFSKLDIDRPMPPPTPTINIRIRNHESTIELTRRRFLGLMFAFLTAESVFLSIMLAFGLPLAGSIKEATPIFLRDWVAYIGYFAFLLLFAQMVVTTVWGLYYLGERIHQPDATMSQ